MSEETKQMEDQPQEEVIILNPEKRNQNSSRKVMLWIVILVLVLVFGLMMTENQKTQQPNATEIEMFQEQLNNDVEVPKTNTITSPNGKYSEEEVGNADGEHVMDKAWRGSDTTPADKNVDTEKLDEFQEKIMPPDKK